MIQSAVRKLPLRLWSCEQRADGAPSTSAAEHRIPSTFSTISPQPATDSEEEPSAVPPDTPEPAVHEAILVRPLRLVSPAAVAAAAAPPAPDSGPPAVVRELGREA